MNKHPVGFMSYVRIDDQHESGRLSQFCDRLTGEVRMQTGEEFRIFQDRNDIAWGQQWQQRIVLGEVVAMLVNEELNVGTHTTQWNASGMASGLYFY